MTRVFPLTCVVLAACASHKPEPSPKIEFTRIPESGIGGNSRLDTIEGHVRGAKPGQRIVLFAKSGVWWVQPFSNQPFTAIRSDSTWTSQTHLGTEYAALLVESEYYPPATSPTLPAKGAGIAAVAIAKGLLTERSHPKTLQFSGYEWDVRSEPSDRGGTSNDYEASNAWTDANGWLHLRIAKVQEGWTCAEVILKRSLGYGSYGFRVQDVLHLEPAAVFGIYTWDDVEAGQNHREIDIEISRWGDPISKNAQYAIQPYYVPVNVVRFMTPPGVLTHSFRWEPGRVSFKTARGSPTSAVVSQHSFTSGIPSPGEESIRMNLYVYGRTRTPLQKETEVVIEKFEYLP